MSDEPDTERVIALPESLSAREREAFERLSAARVLFVLQVQYAGKQRHVICEARNVEGNESLVPLAMLIDSDQIRDLDFGDEFSSFVTGEEP